MFKYVLFVIPLLTYVAMSPEFCFGIFVLPFDTPPHATSGKWGKYGETL